MLKTTGKRVLITGASSGIGLALAAEFARKKARVVMASRDPVRLEKAAREVSRAFPRSPAPMAVQSDVTDQESVRQLIQTCMDDMGGVDILVNDAGIGVYGDAFRTSVADFREVMEVNFFGSLRCILEALPAMRKAGHGHIINIASVAAKYGVPYLAAYGASKAAVVALSQSLRAELSRDGISVMIVYPGYTETEFFMNEKKVGGGRRPERPYARAEKVARAIVRAFQAEKRDLVLSFEGRALGQLHKFSPRLVEAAMKRVAAKLRDPEEEAYG
jgi:short-subunit dehydrogenase